CHAGPELLEEFLTRHEGVFDFVQIQCNYLDWTLQDAKTKYDIITRHGLGVWVMEPCRGGKLASLPEEQAAKLDPSRSIASYAFRFLISLLNIRMILSGMNDMSQVKDNLATFEEARPLSDEERNTLFEIAESLKRGVPCTGCRYCCDGCPVGLNIPYLLECYNDYKYGGSMTPTMRISGLPEEKRPSACIGCGQCAHACPQGIDVPSVMAELAEIYEKAPKWEDQSKSRQEKIRKDLGME
ncbi:MAG: 4Fe-4S dicluster domain-containing protein, partial [Erysipelotrichaceae bacterium]|nr:4Fe-4S dicluster domain-containing protein [Erysipelotrichaceae bacterium]